MTAKKQPFFTGKIILAQGEWNVNTKFFEKLAFLLPFSYLMGYNGDI